MTTPRILILLAIFVICLTPSGCSDSDTTIIEPPLDTVPPAIPTGLTVCSGDCVIKLSWEENVTDSDLLGFHVYRLNSENSWVLTVTPVENSYFVDCSPVGGDCMYRVTAVDLSGNESAWAEVAYRRARSDRDLDNP
ncbi:MAG: hypothetical protein GY780_11930 [bacterium]|nr:hypothetical protein [bacterium]